MGFSGWKYIGDRLESKYFEYEETGWYDFNAKEKPMDVRARDQMLFTYEVDPALTKLKTSMSVAAAVSVLSIACFVLFAPTDPDEMYSSGYLSNLSTNQEVAEEAQKDALRKLGNKPA